MKVMLITNMIGPYCVPFFNFVSEQGGFNFAVVALTKREKNRDWKFNEDKIKFQYQILPGRQWFFCGRKRELAIHLNKDVFHTLRQYNPDVVVTTGYDTIAYWQAFLYCKFAKKKYILWNGTTFLSAHGTKGLHRLLKTIIIRKADKYLAYGTKAKEYLESFGAKRQDIHIATNTVDVNYFRNEILRYRNNNNFREERNKYPKILLLSVGQLVKRKGVEQLLKALLCLDDPEIGCIILGNGPEEKYLQRFCVDNKLHNVFFEGFRQQEDMPKYYALADIFILPSFEEVWGLVVNEALAGGLYVFCSKYTGAAYDLIKKDWNGELFDPSEIADISALIKQAKENIGSIRSRREDISRSICREYSIAKSGRSFLRAIDSLKISSPSLDKRLLTGQTIGFESESMR